MLDIAKLLKCFPEPAEEFHVKETKHEIIITHRDTAKDPAESSKLELGLNADEVELKYIAITEAYQCMGYGRKLLTEFYKQCKERKLSIAVDQAYYPTRHIFEGIIQNESDNVDYYCEELADAEAWEIRIQFIKDSIPEKIKISENTVSLLSCFGLEDIK